MRTKLATLRKEQSAIIRMHSEVSDTIASRDAEIRRLRAALARIKAAVGTSTETWHIAHDALETKEAPYGLPSG